MAFYNLKTTYTIIMENTEVFNSLLDKSNDSPIYQEDTKNTSRGNKNVKNLFFLDTYNNVLENHLDEMNSQKTEDKTKIARINECLSFEHLLSKNIIHSGEKYNGKTTFSITNHLLEIIKDIYKEKSKPLNKTQYVDFITLVKKYKNSFEDNIHNKTSKEIVEQKLSFENLLEEIYGKTLSSISSLEYETQNSFSKTNYVELNDIDIEKQKLKEAKHLQERYISPLYAFVNNRTSTFMNDLNTLRNLFDEENKHYGLLQTINHYYLQYLFIVKKIKPIKNYIHSYVKQSELNLHRNIGNEKLFNQINVFINEFSLGSTRKTKIWSFNQDKLKKICYFYENKAEQFKDFNVKSNKVNKYFLTRGAEFIEEQGLEINLEIETKLFINKEYEKIMKANENKIKRAEINKIILDLFDRHSKKTIFKEDMEIVPFIINFLEESEKFKYDWTVGHLESLTKSFTRNNVDNITLRDEFKQIKKGDVEVTYQKITWRETEC